MMIVNDDDCECDMRTRASNQLLHASQCGSWPDNHLRMFCDFEIGNSR